MRSIRLTASDYFRGSYRTITLSGERYWFESSIDYKKNCKNENLTTKIKNKNKMNNKIFLKVVTFFSLFVLVIPWTFNHINPWVGVALFVAAAYWINTYINKFIG